MAQDKINRYFSSAEWNLDPVPLKRPLSVVSVSAMETFTPRLLRLHTEPDRAKLVVQSQIMPRFYKAHWEKEIPPWTQAWNSMKLPITHRLQSPILKRTASMLRTLCSPVGKVRESRLIRSHTHTMEVKVTLKSVVLQWHLNHQHTPTGPAGLKDYSKTFFSFVGSTSLCQDGWNDCTIQP